VPPTPPVPPALECKYAVAPSSQSVAARGGEFSFTVTTSAGCKWSVTSSASWVAIPTGGGAGESRVTYVVSTNEGSARTGRIEVAGKTVTIAQEAPALPTLPAICKYEVSPLSQSVTDKGGEFSVSVKTAADCKWSASPSHAWIAIRSGSGAAGDGRVTYVVSSNDGAARSGKIAVTISQEAPPRQPPACTISLSPGSHSVPVEGGVFSIKVSVDTRCSWSAEGGASWITFKTRSGTGSGEFVFVVERNSGPARSAAITVSGQAVKVSQAGVR
jgi:hypothetical protein